MCVCAQHTKHTRPHTQTNKERVDEGDLRGHSGSRYGVCEFVCLWCTRECSEPFIKSFEVTITYRIMNWSNVSQAVLLHVRGVVFSFSLDHQNGVACADRIGLCVVYSVLSKVGGRLQIGASTLCSPCVCTERTHIKAATRRRPVCRHRRHRQRLVSEHKPPTYHHHHHSLQPPSSSSSSLSSGRWCDIRKISNQLFRTHTHTSPSRNPITCAHSNRREAPHNMGHTPSNIAQSLLASTSTSSLQFAVNGQELRVTRRTAAAPHTACARISRSSSACVVRQIVHMQQINAQGHTRASIHISIIELFVNVYMNELTVVASWRLGWDHACGILCSMCEVYITRWHNSVYQYYCI